MARKSCCWPNKESSTLYLEVSGCLLLDLVCQRVDLEPVQPGHELQHAVQRCRHGSIRAHLVGRPLGSVLRVDHEQHVGEPGPEVGAVRVVVPASVYLHSHQCVSVLIEYADRQSVLRIRDLNITTLVIVVSHIKEF